MQHTLRDYQERAVSDALAALADNPCVAAPTGSGKTHIGCEIVRRAARPALWISHRRELIQQAADRLRAFGVPCGIILAGHPRFPGIAVQVASVQTLSRRTLPRAELIIIDEAHHTISDSFRRILADYAGVPRVGLTATPFRLDGKGLGDIFGRIIVAAHTDELVATGTLIEPRVYGPPAASVAGIKIKRGDYEAGPLAEACDRPKLIGDIVKTWQKHADGLRTVCFAVNVPHSQHIAAEFNAAGIPAVHIDGGTPAGQRAAAFRDLANGRALIFCNCMIAGEGVDIPSLECAIIARPTASLGLHLQQIGRIMRSCPGKTAALVLDHAGNFQRHGRVTQRIEYTLADGAVVTPASASTGLRTCLQCYRLNLASRTHCQECGAELKSPPVLPEHEAGELEAWDASAGIEVQEQAFNELLAEARETGRKPGWAFYRFKERFGHAPSTITQDGEHVFINPATASEELRQSAFERWIAEGEQKGFKPGYAAVRFKQIFGTWPRRARRAVA